MSETSIDPLTAAKIAKEQKLVNEKGKHKSVKTTTIGRKGKIQGVGGMTFSTEKGEDSSKVVKRERTSGYSSANLFPKGAIGIGRIQQPEDFDSSGVKEENG